MRLNVDWLRDWVDTELNPAEIADCLTIAGHEVSSIEPVTGNIEGLVVGQIVSVKPHPDADRLVICQVNDGRKEHTVVCGAPNATNNLKAPFAPVGALLPGDIKIKRTKLRGIMSSGMLCSSKELGLSENSSGLLVLPEDAPTGKSIKEYLRLDDSILDLELTPNRGDCFSVLGIAREIAAIEELKLGSPSREIIDAQNTEMFEVKLQANEACPSFCGRVIRNVSISADTPIWMAERLRRAGLRTINPVVDITNYVMLELGQPLHGYDVAKLDTEIIVRFAKEAEKLTLLDGRELTLHSDVMVIADDSGAIGLAGIMGGKSTAVDGSTKNVFLEAAFFSPDAMAGRARRYKLHTDASMRFERGVDPEIQNFAMERATNLLLEIAGGEAGPIMVTKQREHLPETSLITLRHDRLQSMLGLNIAPAQIEKILKALGMKVNQQHGAWHVKPPSFRFDLSIEEDLIEEVARMIGYANIPVTPELTKDSLGGATEETIEEEQLKDLLARRGYSEIISYTFVDEELESMINPGTESIRLVNPISTEQSVLRRSLWPGLLKTAVQNMSRQHSRMRLFETGTQFLSKDGQIDETTVLAGLAAGARWPEHWDFKKIQSDFFDIKGDIEAIFSFTGMLDKIRFVAAEHPALKPGQTARVEINNINAGWLGILHPAVEQQLGIRTSVVLFSLRLKETLQSAIPVFQAYSKFPSIRRDIALLVDENISVNQILNSVRLMAGDVLQNVIIFDVYRGEGIDSRLKSIGLGLILQDNSRTLTDVDADRVVLSVTERLEHVHGAKLRI